MVCRAKLSIKAVELVFRVDWSGCSMVFVDGAAEDTSPPYGRVDRHDNAWIVVGWPLLPALMWTVTVEMPLVGGQDRASVLLAVDQDVVGALPAYGAHEPFCVTVRPRRPRWSLDHVDAHDDRRV